MRINHGGTEDTENSEDKEAHLIIEERLSEAVIGAAIEVHRILGPGLLESAYQRCLEYELELRGIPFQRQVDLPIVNKGVELDCGYKMDLVVEGKLVLELKAVEKLTDLHEAQLLTYLRLSSVRVGLLLNFNSVLLRDGIVRRVL
jgi:GxxExxY protein